MSDPIEDERPNDGEPGQDDPSTPDTRNPDLLLLPHEVRSWTGLSEAHRYFPERVFLAPEWLEPDEAVEVNRKVWNDFVAYLERGEYSTLLKFAERIEARVERRLEGVNHLQRILRAEEAKLAEARRMRKAMGADTSVEESLGTDDAEGWERRGVLVAWDLDPGAIGESTIRPLNALLSFRVGTTWKAAVATQVSRRDEIKARFISAQKTYLLIGYRRDVLGEVLRHYEEYGFCWQWDYDDLGDEEVEVDESEGDFSAGARVSYDYELLAEKYHEIKGEHPSALSARNAVCDWFEEQGFGGRPNETTVRRALGER